MGFKELPCGDEYLVRVVREQAVATEGRRNTSAETNNMERAPQMAKELWCGR